MLFNSYAFWMFLALLWVMYRLLPHRGQNTLLLVASYFFYGCWDWKFVPLILTVTLVNYFTALGIEADEEKKRRRAVTGLSFVLAAVVTVCIYYWGAFDWFIGNLSFNDLLNQILSYGLILLIGVALTLVIAPLINVVLVCLTSWKRFSFDKWLIVISAIVSLGLLAFFKYWGFFTESAAEMLTWLGFHADMKMLSIILPVGISFYTFQTMSYTIDVYRGKIKATRSLPDFALYVAYFPQLVAGPIERSSSLMPQITRPRRKRVGDFSEGLYLVIFGLFLKVVVGDNLGFIADGIFGAQKGEINGTEALVGVYCFAFQIYGDFAGYSSIARGVSKWLNIDLMTNFRMPYLARNPSDFWQRWHISLSSWLRDYLYIPLGGNRCSEWKIYRNLMITMLLGGLWHGAGWTFIVWGGIHGAILCIYRLIGDRWKLHGLAGRVMATFWFFQIVCLTWLFFRADNFDQAWEMLRLIFTDHEMTPLAHYGLRMIAFFCVPLMAYEIWLDQTHSLRRLETVSWGWRAVLYCYFIFMLIVCPPPVFGQFIYFQF